MVKKYQHRAIKKSCRKRKEPGLAAGLCNKCATGLDQAAIGLTNFSTAA